MKATIYFHNDPSVGIMSQSFDMELPFNMEDAESRADFNEIRENMRAIIKETYYQMDGNFKPNVWFEDEMETRG